MAASGFCMQEARFARAWSHELEEGASVARARLRTDSCFGMPVSPWQPSEGLAAQLTKAAQALHAGGGFQASGIPVMAAAWGPAPPCYATSMQTPALPIHWESPASPPGVFNVQSSLRSSLAPSVSSNSDARTTVMFRNLPESFSRADLLRLLDSKGFRGRYDFVYLPFNFDTQGNLRHAFINMVTTADAERLWEEFDGFSCWSTPCDCQCAMAWNDKQQGIQALIERYRNSPVLHEEVPDLCKPLIFEEGEVVQFPAATQVIKPPKFRRKSGANLKMTPGQKS